MRDPWFPAILMLLVLLAVWLGIVGPMPEGFTKWLSGWQTLLAASVASLAAYIAFRNTTRSIEHAAQLEQFRRSRKHVATRVLLSGALAQAKEYAQRSARILVDLTYMCRDKVLPADAKIPDTLPAPLPSDALKALADFIEYADSADVGVVEGTIKMIQIHDSHVRSVLSDHKDPGRVALRSEIEESIIAAACVYAGAESGLEYGRGRADQLPAAVTWDNVRDALRSMGFPGYSELRERLDDVRGESTGPFDAFRPRRKT